MGLGRTDSSDASGRASERQVTKGFEGIDAINRAAKESSFNLSRGSNLANARLDPFSKLTSQGLDASSILTDPQAQADYLQNSPVFQQALQNANQNTNASAAARGRISAGDTQTQLAGNTLLAAQPLLQQQQQNVSGLIDRGLNIAGQQGQYDFSTGQGLSNISQQKGFSIADLLTQIGNSQSAGIIGRQNQQNQQNANFQNAAIQGISLVAGASDIRLKKNIKEIGTMNGFTKYSWDWNDLAKEKLGLQGSEEGVIAQEVEAVKPDLIIEKNGFKHVNYGALKCL
jgi:hypothetical protein